MHHVKVSANVIPPIFFLFVLTISFGTTEGGFACLSNPCIHGVCLDDLNTTYSCYCIDGYTGIQCQTNWDECWSSPCQNGGVCQDGIAAFNCTCPSGFAGDLCEENLNECLSNPCQNNATCLDAANGYTCNCLPGYAGVHCELDIAVCNLTSEARCANGGMCVEGPGFTFNCKCAEGWTGLLCELEIDECMSHPCQNGAVCVDLHADYECACTFGYAGRNCEETVLICEDSPCKNDALCLMEDDKPVCYCVPDYHGERCQFQYDECKLSNNRCLNGGSCIDGVDGFTCSCPPRLTGLYCECQIVELRGRTYLDCSAITNLTRTTDIITFTDYTTTTLRTSVPSSPSTEVIDTTTQTVTPMPNVPNSTSTSSQEEITFTTPSTEIFTSTTTPFTVTTTEEIDTSTTSTSSTLTSTESTTTEKEIATTETTEVTMTTTESTSIETTSTSPITSSPSTNTIISTTEESEGPTSTTTVESIVTSTSSSEATSTTSTTEMATSTTEMTTTEEVSVEITTSSTTDFTTSTFSSSASTETTLTTHTTTEMTPSPSSSTLSTVLTDLPVTSTSTATESVVTDRETTTEIITSSDTPSSSISTSSSTEETETTKNTFVTGFPHVTDFITTSTTTEMPVITTETTTESIITETTEVTSATTPELLFDCSKSEQSCQNGGTCIYSYSDGFHCACLYDFSGDRCETSLGITNAAFNGKSYILHKMSTQNGSQMEVQFTARTSWESGVLFYASIQDTYMALYMEQAHLKFKFSCGYQTMLLSELNKPVNNGNELRISALLTFSDDRHHCNASIKLNETLTMSGAQIAKMPNSFKAKTTAYLYLGGLSEKTHSMLKLPGFIGCMSNLIIAGEAIRIFKDAEDAFGVSECSSLACLSNPCKHGATCTALPGNSLDNYVCSCTNGYVGKQCDKSVCENNPCMFGGTCLPFTGSGYLCLCPLGKHGHFCENDLKISKAYYSSSVQGYASYTSHPVPRTSYKNMYIKFKITPSSLNQISLLMFMGQEGQHDFHSSHMAVSFVKGFIMLTWNLGSGPRRIFTEKPIPADKASYEIQLGRSGRRAWLHVEHIGNVTGRSQGSLSRLDVEPFVYFGGYKSKAFEGLPHDLPLHSGFAGCLYDIVFKVGDVAIPLENGRVTGRAVGQCGTTECYEGVCQNQGACLYHGGTFTCMCQDGYYGPLCSNKFNVCDRSSCAPTASCVPLIAGYECDCPVGKKGKYCQENETLSDISFTGTRSYLVLPARTFEANKFNFDLELRPFADGLVAFVGNHDYFFSLTLLSGLLELRILPSRQKRHKRERIILRSNKLLRLGMWHQVKVQVYGRKIYLFVDNIVNTAVMQPDDSLDLSNEEIYLGGLPDLSSVPQQASCEFPRFYKGCVRKLFIDTVHVALNDKTILRGQNLVDCDGTPCGGDFCSNGGTCWLDPNVRPHCNCPDPYYGEKCERMYDCVEHKCKNDGYCLEGRCVCKVGYVGMLCETGLTIRSPKFVGRSYLYINANSSYPPPKTIEIGSNAGIISGKKRNSLSEPSRNITIQFVTASDGLLLLANGHNWFALGLNNGKLTLQNAKQVMEILSSPVLTDGLEHDMVLKFLPFRVSVDSKDYEVGNFSYVELEEFYLGGVPGQVMGLMFEGFDGCINTFTSGNEATESVDFNTYKGENVEECHRITELANY